MWGFDAHSLNPKIIYFHVEISISNHLFVSHESIFLIYKKRFIENYWRI
jgi:hypothetical protein